MTRQNPRSGPPSGDGKSDTRAALTGELPRLRAFAISLCGDRQLADDLVQETLVKAWAHLDSFEDGTNLKGWLFTILRNTYFSERRKRRNEVRDEDGKLAGRLVSSPEQDGHIDLRDLAAAMARLAPEQREALVLIGAEGLSYAEAAKICNCRTGTIKSRVNRARCRLAQLLGRGAPQHDDHEDDGVRTRIRRLLARGR